MEYTLVQFTFGLDIQAYQELSNNVMQRLVNLDGTELIPPTVCEYHIIDANPPTPEWA